MDDMFRFSDQLGPLKIIHVYEPSISLKAILVVDNIARGPAMGGMRLSEDVSVEECFRLARAMTYKNAAADLPHGGGKMVIFGDPKMPKSKKESLIRGLAQALKNETTYIFAPDMGTDEESMAWIRDEVGRVVGLPRELGGIPLDEIGATGWGLLHAAQVGCEHIGIPMDGSRIVVQGFGAVGLHTARFMVSKGCVLVGVADSKGAVTNKNGFDVSQLINLKRQGGSVVDYEGSDHIKKEELIDVACDIWIPAARPDVINEENVERLNTKMILQGANIPASLSAEKRLHQMNILNIPDFIANAGGVICGSMEYHGAQESAVMSTIADKVARNTSFVLNLAKSKNILPREAAREMAKERIEKAMGFRRWNLFSSSPDYL